MSPRRATKQARKRASRPAYTMAPAGRLDAPGGAYEANLRRCQAQAAEAMRRHLKTLAPQVRRSIRAAALQAAPHIRQALDTLAGMRLDIPPGLDAAAFRATWRALMADHRPRIIPMTNARQDAHQEPLPAWKPYEME